MPKYDFVCNKCGNRINDMFIPAEQVSGNNDSWKIVCSTCKVTMEVVFTVPAIHWKGEAPPGMAIKTAHEVDKAMEIYEEGFTSDQELRESMEIAKEEEIKRDKPKGLLTTGVESVKTKEHGEVVQKRAKRKAAEARKMRGVKSCH